MPPPPPNGSARRWTAVSRDSVAAPRRRAPSRTGRDDIAREILTFRDPMAEQWRPSGWFDRWKAVEVFEVFAGLGRPDLIRDWTRVNGERYSPEELLARAETNARLGMPRRLTARDLAALAEAYAALLKTPRTQRGLPIELLILQAAENGHIGAVLDLIPKLNADDFNGRASHAFRSLWIIATGADVEPW
jgi:hypothetical protein